MKIIKFLAAVSFLSLAAGLSAQNEASGAGTENTDRNSGDSLYVFHLNADRVYLHNDGYAIQYKKDMNVNRMAYLPMKWFYFDKEKNKTLAEVVLLEPGRTWPHAVFFYRNGALDHIKLYIRKEMAHPSWGMMQPYTDYKDLFNVSPENFKLDLK